MTEPPHPLPPASKPQIQALLQTRITAVVQVLKRNRLAQLGILLAISLLLLIITALIQLGRSRSQVTINQPPLILPSPSPTRQTRFTNHPTIIETEQLLEQVTASAAAQIIDKHPLTPPILDMEVTLEE